MILNKLKKYKRIYEQRRLCFFTSSKAAEGKRV